MVIRYLTFFPCLQSEIDCLYQNVYSQKEKKPKGTVHEIPGILSELFAFITATDNPIIFQEFDFFSNVSNIKSVM